MTQTTTLHLLNKTKTLKYSKPTTISFQLETKKTLLPSTKFAELRLMIKVGAKCSEDRGRPSTQSTQKGPMYAVKVTVYGVELFTERSPSLSSLLALMISKHLKLRG